MQSYMDSSMQNLDDLCRYIVQHEHKDKEIVTNLRLQKLLYFIQAECLVGFKEPCFLETIQAWRYGPVVPEAYHKYKFYGSIGIVPEPWQDPNRLIPNNRVRQLVDNILRQTRPMSTEKLVDITHRQKPWRDAYGNGEGSDKIISLDAIQSYFTKG